MSLLNWLRGVHRRPVSRRPQAVRFRPRLEALEDRCLPSTLVVTSPLDNGSQGTLRYDIAHAASGDTILITPALHGAPIVLTQGELLLNKDLTIEGLPNQLETISGNNNSRVFEVTANAHITLSDLTITGGNGVANNPNTTGFDGLGGGILNLGMLTLTDCTVSGNSAGYFGLGGGIFSGNINYPGTPATLTVSGSTLSYNQADYGGGIYNGNSYGDTTPSMLTVSGSTLSHNSAGNAGGGIYNQVGTATVSNNSILSDNYAGSVGGGILNFGMLTISNSTLADNSASYDGGGIYNFGTTVTILNSTLSGNSASHDGGGIYNDVLTLSISGCTLSDNSAGNDGGGIYNNVGTVTAIDSIFSGNSATGDGGAIYNNGPFYLGTLTVTDCVFCDNRPDDIANFGVYNDGGGNQFSC